VAEGSEQSLLTVLVTVAIYVAGEVLPHHCFHIGQAGGASLVAAARGHGASPKLAAA
jgi:hypothetical protein